MDCFSSPLVTILVNLRVTDVGLHRSRRHVVEVYGSIVELEGVGGVVDMSRVEVMDRGEKESVAIVLLILLVGWCTDVSIWGTWGAMTSSRSSSVRTLACHRRPVASA